MPAKSLRWRLEEFDAVACGIIKQDLLAAVADDDVVPKMRPPPSNDVASSVQPTLRSG